jgi:hypothetical protein
MVPIDDKAIIYYFGVDLTASYRYKIHTRILLFNRFEKKNKEKRENKMKRKDEEFIY